MRAVRWGFGLFDAELDVANTLDVKSAANRTFRTAFKWLVADKPITVISAMGVGSGGDDPIDVVWSSGWCHVMSQTGYVAVDSTNL
jgi:hypothetical protein